MAFTSIGSILPDHIKKSKAGEQLEATVVLELFMKKAKELWGNQVEQDMKPLYVKNNTLTVAVTSSPLAQEMKLKEQEILDFLKNQNTGVVVDRLRYLL
ncbi:MAG: DciA family protein [Patescibacteria group bacterium]